MAKLTKRQRSIAAKKGWETRRTKDPKKKKHTTAKKSWETQHAKDLKKKKRIAAKDLKKKKRIAAKKGWETRRAKDLKKKKRDLAKRHATLNKLPKKFSKLTKGKRDAIKMLKAKVKELEAKAAKREASLAELQLMNDATHNALIIELTTGEKARQEIVQQRKILAEHALLETFVDDDSMGWYTREGRKALKYSKLRQISGSDSLWEAMKDYYEHHSALEWREYVEEIADYYDCDVNEVFEFYHSP
jgi:hypothetical protein